MPTKIESKHLEKRSRIDDEERAALKMTIMEKQIFKQNEIAKQRKVQNYNNLWRYEF